MTGCGDHFRQLLYQQAREKRKASLEKRRKKQLLEKKRPITAKRKRTMKLNRLLAATKRQLWDWIVSITCDSPICLLCEQPILKFSDSAICHKVSRGMGGGKRDDDNVFLGHHTCNSAQGSMSLETYLLKPLNERRKLCGGM